MDASEGHRDVGRMGRSTGNQRFESKDLLKTLLDLVRKEGAARDAAADDNKGGSVEDWGGDEFDGIRSEVDFRRAMQLEEERLRAAWTQRTLPSWRGLLSWRGLRFLR